jgi:hypothetical protein
MWRRVNLPRPMVWLMSQTIEPVIARKTWRSVEPIHGMIYFAPEAEERYASLGLGDRSGYFASRSAAMGPVDVEVVVATFFNFHPGLVRRSMEGVWSRTGTEAVLAARLESVDAALRRGLGDSALASKEMARAAQLARIAAETACERPEGRPLFAGHSRLPWPDEDHLVLWHAQTLLREFRGDGHVAALCCAGLTGAEALVVHAASGEVAASVLRASREWPDDEWAAAVESIRSRGWLADGEDLELSASGAEHRKGIEDQTDALAVHPYAALGEDLCAELRTLARPFSQAIVAGGMVGFARSAK